MSADLAAALAAAPAVRSCREALTGRDDVWLVGGAVRDALLGREVVDVDLAVGSDPAGAAAQVANVAAGRSFELSPEFATWRAVAPGWHVDATGLRGDGIAGDLAQRDFTVDAIALPLAELEAAPIDPHGGLPDMEHGLLRAVSEHSFADDPLRLLRAARLAAGLGFELEAETVELARAAAPRGGEPAGERQLAELRQLLAGPEPVRALELLDRLGVTAAVLPELEALRGVEQNPYHHLDVHGHTLDVLARLVEVETSLERYAGEHAEPLRELLAQPLADEFTRGGALRLAAVVHDFGKPETRSVAEGGRILFVGHDRAGARIVRELCRRLRTSRKLADFLANLTRNHLRLGFLVHERPLARRATYEYLRATAPDAAEVTLLTVADRLATQGERTRREAIDAHLELARELLGEALAWRRTGPPAVPIAGDELAATLEIEPGPQLGRVLEELRVGVFCGEIADRDGAIRAARRALAKE